ncbi:MAG: amidohydrolase family protein [Eubacteriales bacterium]|nr:amidohydrolase family protein [Eubacteriales bacterium]
MSKTLFINGHIHTMTAPEDVYSCLGVDGETICYVGNAPGTDYDNTVDLNDRHVYPTMTDAHLHLLYTIVLAAASFNVCEITPEGIAPRNLVGVEKRIRSYCRENPKQKIITGNQYIISAVEEKRLPTRQELDDWTGGRAMVIYNIDGHSSSMSTGLMELLALPTEGHNGIFSGEEHEFMQGKVTALIASKVTPALLSRGIANFSNLCAHYGISRVCAMDGNEDENPDRLTGLLAFLARRMDIDVRLFPQYMTLDRAEQLSPKLRCPRAGGCAAWELDGSVGSHSAAFYTPYADDSRMGHCYYKTETVAQKVAYALRQGIQLSSHAIGEAAIDQITGIYAAASRLPTEGPLMRIDHFEFPTRQAVDTVKHLPLAITIQPGYAWIDKRYLHSYEQFLPPEIIAQQAPLKELMAAGVCLCGSSDSPVQSISPYDQMLGMVEHYLPEVSLTPYEALLTYTVNGARMLGELEHSGTLEAGKDADFFTADWDINRVTTADFPRLCAEEMYVRGRRWRKKQGTVGELLTMLMQLPHKI